MRRTQPHVPHVQWRTSSGDPITVGALTITPRATALTIRLGPAAFVWNRPTGVDVERGGVRSRLRIVDRGRIAWLASGGLLVLLAVLGVARASPRKEEGR